METPCVNCERLREIHTALLIDLRALVEQWRQFAINVRSSEECSAVMRCYNDLRARLSREPHQDAPQHLAGHVHEWKRSDVALQMIPPIYEWSCSCGLKRQGNTEPRQD